MVYQWEQGPSRRASDFCDDGSRPKLAHQSLAHRMPKFIPDATALLVLEAELHP